MEKKRLDTARVFERVFSIYRSQAAVLLPAALILYLIPAALLVTDSVWLPLAASFIGTVYYQGMVVQAVRDIQDSVRNLSIGGLFRSVGPAFAPLLWTALLIFLGVFIGVVLLIVPGLILATMWAVAIPVVVCEALGAPAALGRSGRLVSGHGWQVFGVLVVMVLILVGIDAILATIAEAVSGSNILAAIANLLGSALTAPLFALAASVLYLELLEMKGERLPPADMARFSRGR